MKAVYIKGKEDLEIADVPVPEPGPGQVRIAVEYVGICGSDLHYYFNGANGTFVIREPLIPGHEMSGHLDLDPQGEWAPGTPITLHPATFGPDQPGMENLRHLRPGGSYLGSASTWPHTQGAMAEYMLVNRDMIRLLPESVDSLFVWQDLLRGQCMLLSLKTGRYLGIVPGSGEPYAADRPGAHPDRRDGSVLRWTVAP